MMKSFLLAAVVALMAVVSFNHASANDDIFLDEGDGGFDTAESSPGGEDSAPLGEDPFATGEEGSAPPSVSPRAVAPVVSEPVPPAMAPAIEPPVKKTKPVAKVAAPPKVKAERKAASRNRGSFQTTNGECPMMRSPASAGSPMLVVKGARRVWVEEEDHDWVKAYNQRGEAGYLSRECFR